MQFDPLSRHKFQDDWAPIPNRPKRKSPKRKSPKCKLILLPNHKYVKYKGTMKRVKITPEPAIPCVVMRWVDGEPNAVPMRYIEDEKRLVFVADGFVTEFNSRSEAKKAVWHTCQQEGVPDGYVDFQIVNK